MNKAYTRINWENEPSDNTPINETNLNKMDFALDELDNRVIAQDTSKADKTEVSTLIANVEFNESTGIITVTRKNGSSFTIDTKLEKIAINFTYDKDTQQIILTLVDGTKQYIDLSALITQYEFLDSDTITFVVQADGSIKAEVLDESITENKLQPNYLAQIKVETAKSEIYMNNAGQSAKSSSDSANMSKSYAVGGTGTREGEDTDNAKYYSDNAKPLAKTVSGTNPTIPDSTKAPLIYGKFNGYTEQKTLSGKNLLNPTLETTTQNGVTCTNNGDGTYTINGTNTGSETVYFNIGTFTTSGIKNIRCLNNSTAISYITKTTDFGYIRAEGISELDNAEYVFVIKVDSGVTVNNSIAKPMITDNLSVTYDDFEPYCGGTPSPNPDYPQDIQGLGDSGSIEVKTCGKNLFDKNNPIYVNGLGLSNSGYFSRSDQRSYVFEVDGESAVISYTKTLDGSRYCAFSDEIPSAVNSTHDDRFLIALEKGDIYYIATNENHRKYLIIALVTTEDTSTLQVEKGISYTTYEPYTETTASIPITSPLYDGDYMEVYADGSGKIVRKNAKIDSYAGEEITTEYVSTTGELSEGATVVYKLATQTEEPLTPEQVEQFKQLYTFDNVTNVICDGETTIRYYVNNDNGDTVGMLQEEVDELKNDLDKLNSLPVGTVLQLESDKDIIQTTTEKYGWQYLGTSNIQYDNGAMLIIETNVYRKNS